MIYNSNCRIHQSGNGVKKDNAFSVSWCVCGIRDYGCNKRQNSSIELALSNGLCVRFIEAM